MRARGWTVLALAAAGACTSRAPGPPAPSAEARTNVLTLCQEVIDHGSEGFFPAGPTPPTVPRGIAVPFPEDPAFERLGFRPGPAVRYQYEVLAEETPVGDFQVRCVARGDLDGDGQTSELSVTIGASGRTGAVEALREDE